MAKIQQKVIGGQVIGMFVVLKDFDAVVHGAENHYHQDMTYWLRKGNDELYTKAVDWQDKGLVRITMRE